MKKDDDKDIEAQFREKIYEDIRPWGKFRSYPYREAKSIKVITINPGEALSLQYHHNRCEFWVVLDEGLEVIVCEKVWQPRENEEIFIPRKAAHRLRCLGPKSARVMEIWIGDSEEEDIVRLEDDYGREES